MTLEKLTQENQGALIALMREFYHSPAVLAPVPDAHFEATCAEILSGSPFAAAFLVREADENAGYAQLSFTYSNEAGGMVVWIEELYIRPAFQNRGLGRACLGRRFAPGIPAPPASAWRWSRKMRPPGGFTPGWAMSPCLTRR